MTTDPKNTPRATGPAPSTSPPVSPRPKPFFCLDSILFGSRWALYPMNIGLMLALTVYLMRFFWQVGVLLFQSGPLIMEPGFDDHVLLGHIVGLLDQAMVCSLLIMTIMGGHQIYVRRFRDELTAAGPYWLKRVDTIVLKVKLGLAFTGVSSVVLLRDCISIETVPTNVWMAHVVIHVVFLGTTIITAIVWRIMHPEAGRSEAQPPASHSVAAAPSQPPST
jgi:uncharacterized protein (TIGR00645 family)